MKESWLLVLLFFGLVFGYQAEGAQNLTLSTTKIKESVGRNVYPKLAVNDTLPLTLRCNFNSTLPQTINSVIWKLRNVILQKGEEYDMKTVNEGRLHSASLIIKKPSVNSLGVYQCAISIAVGDTIERNLNIFGPPITVLQTEHSLRVTEGSDLKLPCSYRAHTQDGLKVEWFKGNISIPFSDRGPNVKVEDEEDAKGRVVGKRNVLVFTDIKEDSKGVYYCKVTTSYGTDYLGWQVRVKNRLAYLWPLVGIILEVIIVVIIIIVYEVKRSRRRKAKEQEHANRRYGDDDCISAQPHREYDGDTEVRQRLAHA